MRALLFTSALLLAACVEPSLPAVDAGVDAGPVECSPTTCTGCCRDGVCLGGNEQDACGYDGFGCRACPSDTACVAPGTCVSKPRDAGTYMPRDGGTSLPLDPFTGKPINPDRGRCVFVFWRVICG
jgi:hypothetical protein